jgi:hypothetical protein
MTQRIAIVGPVMAVLFVAANCLLVSAYSRPAAAGRPSASAAASNASGPTPAKLGDRQRLQQLRMRSCRLHPQTCTQGAGSTAATKPRTDGAQPVPRSD